MTLLHDAYTAYLAGLTTEIKAGILWKDEHGINVVIKIIDAKKETYRVRYYHKNGTVVNEKHYKGNFLHGQSIERYTSGKIKKISNFNKGIECKFSIVYDKFGQKIIEETFNNKGAPIDIKRYADGKIYFHMVTISKNTRDVEHYDENENKCRVDRFCDGNLICKTEYHINGKIKSIRRHGEFIAYDTEGNIIERKIYE